MKVGDLVTLKQPPWGAADMLGIVLEISSGSFARIGQPYADKRAHIMWSRPPSHIFSYPRSRFSYETFDVLVSASHDVEFLEVISEDG